MKNILRTALLLFIMTLTSCEKDLYTNEIKSNKIEVKNFSLNELEPSLVSKINKKIKKLEVKKSDDLLQNKNEYIEGLDLYIDKENGKMIVEDGKTTYTFPVYDLQSSDEKIRNLVFRPELNDELKGYLVKYDFTKEELNLMSQEQILQDPAEFYSIDFERMTTDLICVDTQSLQSVPIHEGDLTGEFGNQLIWVTISSQCSWITTDSGSGNTYSGGTYSNGVTHGGGGSSSSNTIATTPAGLSENQKIIKNFQMTVLTSAQLTWLNSQPQIYQNDIYAIITNNEPSSSGNNGQTNVELAHQIVNSMTNNDGYSGDGFMGDSDSDNSDYTGPKQLIPNTITLNDGSVVAVVFGTTSSDNLNSNNLVAVSLVESITHALNEANSNLQSNNKITSIYIAATTNGSHSATSNHSKGTAVDISRINGTKIVNLGANNQVIALQNGFDSYNNIRENFGPYFKHKTLPDGSVNLNWQIAGHQDHIHISVQNN